MSWYIRVHGSGTSSTYAPDGKAHSSCFLSVSALTTRHSASRTFIVNDMRPASVDKCKELMHLSYDQVAQRQDGLAKTVKALIKHWGRRRPEKLLLKDAWAAWRTMMLNGGGMVDTPAAKKQVRVKVFEEGTALEVEHPAHKEQLLALESTIKALQAQLVTSKVELEQMRKALADEQEPARLAAQCQQQLQKDNASDHEMDLGLTALQLPPLLDINTPDQIHCDAEHSIQLSSGVLLAPTAIESAAQLALNRQLDNTEDAPKQDIVVEILAAALRCLENYQEK